jgi:hypothetical protein
VVRVVLVREESERSSWRAYGCNDSEATAQEIVQGVADRWGIEISHRHDPQRRHLSRAA